MKCVCRAVSIKCFLSKPDLPGEPGYSLTALKMGIKDDFRHGKDTTRFKRIEDFFKRCLSVRYFPQHRHEKRPVKLIMLQFAIASSGMNKFDIVKACGLRFFPDPVEHAGLNIESHHQSFFTDLPGQGDSQSTWTTAGVKYRHAGPEVEKLDNDRCPIDSGERIVHFHEPIHPCGAGK